MNKLFEVQDGFLWKAKTLYNEAENVIAKNKALQEVGGMLAKIQEEFVRDSYTDIIAKDLKVKKTQLADFVKQNLKEGKEEATEVDDDLANIIQQLPPEVDTNDWLQYGFYALVDEKKPMRTGYYFNEGRGREQVKLSNFIIKPLFHLYSKEDNKRMVSINNGFEEKILEIPSRNMISLEQFSGTMYEEGHYLFEGNKAQLLKINRKIGNLFPLAYELRTLGYQPEGFFAFANCIVTDKVQPFDELGIAAFEGKNYFSPSCSSIYNQLRADDDPYENDRLLNMKKSSVELKTWIKLFCTTYGNEHGCVGISYLLITCFRDIVFKLDNNCPHLYAFGEKRSGKSKFMESLSAFFFNPLRSFNLNSGTDFAFANYLARFRNCFSFMNEFDDKAIKEEWFQALKTAYDGEGRERGKGGKRNRTEVMKVNSTIGLAGQYLSNRDDNSLLSRSIVLGFKPQSNRSKKVNDAYTKLKALEEQGINSLASDVIAYRKAVESSYSEVFHSIYADMKEWCGKFNHKWEDRINRNHCAMLAMVKIFEKELDLPVSYADFFKQVMEMVVDLTRIMSNSDLLSEFWRIVSSMADGGELVRGYHYRIKATRSIKLRKEEHPRTYSTPKKVLYIRFIALYSLFKKQYRSETGKEAMGAETFINYFESRDYYLGAGDRMRFSGKNIHGKELISSPTSYYMFDYDIMERMGIELDFNPENAPENLEATEQTAAPSEANPFGKAKEDDWWNV